MKECSSLQEVREQIDTIDKELVDLIAKRSHYIRQAAGFKNSIEEVKADERVEYVMQQARKKAIELNVSPNMIHAIFKVMIDEMIESEIAEISDRTTF